MVIQTPGGGYTVSGESNSFGAGSFDAFIVRLDNNGSVLWTRTLGGASDEYGESITQSSDGGYCVAGYTHSFGEGDYDMYISKLDTSGFPQWTRTYGSPGYDYALTVIRTNDGGFALFGSTSFWGAGYNDYYIVKLSSGGTLQWSRTIGGTGGDYGFSIKQTSDGGYILGGTTLSSGAGNYDLQILKLDQIGSLQWNRTEGGLDFDYCYSIIQTNDGGYAAAGSTASFGAGGYDVYMVKLDSGGLLQWNRTIGGAANDAAYSVIQTSDGGYALAGYTYSFGEGDADIYIIKLDSLGNTCGNFSTPSSSTGSGGVQGNPSTLSTSPAISVFSQSPSAATGGLLTTVCVVGIHPVYNEELEKYELLQNFPNPFNPVTNLVFKVSEMGFVKLAVFDMLGREVIVLVNEMLLTGKYKVSWDASGYPSGVYIYELIVVQNGASGGKYSAARKMVLAK